jgi:mannosyltransferase
VVVAWTLASPPMSTNAGRAPRSARWKVPEQAVWLVVVIAATVGGLVLRLLLARTPLWLDEAQSVAIAGLPLDEIPAALREDGHPPLYYVLLHLWMRLMGTGDAAVRSLSVVFGLASLVPIARLGARIGGHPVATAALALAASSPFLVRYATEARMYSLVVLLALVWWLATTWALERPTIGRLTVVAALVAALLYTQYWSLFLLAAGGLVLLAGVRHPGGSGRAHRLTLAATVAGGALFVLWLPSLWVQLQRTGTPWAEAPDPVSAVVYGLIDVAGGVTRSPGLALFAVLVVLVLLGLTGRAVDHRRIELDLAVVAVVRPVAALVGLSTVLALATVWVTGTAFASRYLAIVVGFLLVLAGRGVVTIGDVRWRTLLLAVASGLGLVGSWFAVNDDRSQGREVAAAVAADPAPALVVACPDQLGPALARYLPERARAVGYPTLEPAGRVDWTDYAQRNEAADPAERADRIVEEAAGDPVWLAWREGYRTYDDQCERLRIALADRLGPPVEVVPPRERVFEPMWLTRFGEPRP